MSEEKYFKLDLPSKLIPYSGVEKVEIRMLKGKDEKLIGELDYTNFEQKFKLLLDAILKGINPEELTVGDRLYIMIWLAMNCYSPIYKIPIICEECFAKSDIDINLGDLDKIELSKSYKEPYELKLPSGDKLKLRLFRVKDQIQYIDYVKEKKEDNHLYKLAQSIVDDRNLMERLQYLQNLDTKDLGIIRAFHEKFYHGVKLETSYKCPRCGGAGRCPVPFRLDIIFPDGATIARSLGYDL